MICIGMIFSYPRFLLHSIMKKLRNRKKNDFELGVEFEIIAIEIKVQDV